MIVLSLGELRVLKFVALTALVLVRKDGIRRVGGACVRIPVTDRTGDTNTGMSAHPPVRHLTGTDLLMTGDAGLLGRLGSGGADKADEHGQKDNEKDSTLAHFPSF